jgi:3-hydroxyisobutyrate dehydrogenase-like beta-hydroxyacid dehydrogenase
VFGANGITKSFIKDLLIIDTSTLYYTDAQELNNRLSVFNIEYCDCPISGLPFKARDGTLTLMFGGTEEQYKKSLPYLNMIGKFIYHCGECGYGQLMKAFNNIIYNINIAAICEVFPLAIRSGLDPKLVAEVFITGSSKSFASEYFLPKILKDDFLGDYPMKAAYKDIENVQIATSKIKSKKPITEAMIDVYKLALEKGFGNSSKSAMYKIYEEKYNSKINK